MIKKIDHAFARVTGVMSVVSYAGCIAIMLLNVLDVLLTKLLGSPIVGAYEITQRLLMCTVFASFAYAQTNKTHINMTLLITHFPRVLKFVIFTLMGCLSVYIAATVGYAAFTQAAVSMAKGTVTDVLYIPLYPFFYMESIAMYVFSACLVWDTVLSFLAIFKDDCADMVTASWD